LIELVNAEVAVDDFQRGVVDFNVSAYEPGIIAFQAHIAADPDEYQPQALLYLAWSYEAMDDLEAAMAELELYAKHEPAAALFEQAEMRSRSGEIETAVALYQEFLAEHPEDGQAPLAVWQLAKLIEQTGDIDLAVEQYQYLVEEYPQHENAPEALYHAGWLAFSREDSDTAHELWQRVAEEYSESQFGSAALVRLLRSEQDLDDDLFTALQQLALDSNSDHYHAWRARDVAGGTEPFEPSVPFVLPKRPSSGQAKAERWLLDQLDLSPNDIEDPPGDLGSDLLADERLQIGQKLWELGLFEEAKLELEDLRDTRSDSMLDSYRLALFFRDLGLYRSSIIAGSTVLDLAGQSVVEAPPFIGRLAYPAYYADHIVPLSEDYGFDPRLQFSLVRQESLFESFARSGAAAQGLSQVIPDTGAWIAERLQWEDYENEDLYKPYIGLEFGAYYLARQLDAFDGDIHAALAAYNAGPGNAARWYELAGSDIDQYIDVMDFWETRTYIERIYAGFDIYRSLYEP
jgi:soluble lytic murein transglycosylase